MLSLGLCIILAGVLILRRIIGHSPYGGDSATAIAFREEAISMAKPENLAQTVARYGYAKTKKIKLYGKELELVSDPINPQGDNVLIDAREKGAEHVKQVQVPRNVVEMAKSSRSKRK